MVKLSLTALATYYALLAVFLLISPHTFYETIPGVSSTGPFNSHFARDVGLAFVVSSAGLFMGLWRRDHALMFFGAAFPGLHGVFHILLWAHKGFPFNFTSITDLVGTAGLAALTLLLMLRLKGDGA